MRICTVLIYWILVPVLLLHFTLGADAKEAPARRGSEILTPDLLNTLAQEIHCNFQSTVSSQTGQDRIYIFSSDVAAYDFIERRDTPFGTYRQWDSPYQTRQRRFNRHPDYALDEPYRVMLEGFTRGDLFGPDQIGRQLAAHGMYWTDGPGNYITESMMICKKYGLQKYFFAPSGHIPTTYLESGMKNYAAIYKTEIDGMIDWIEKVTKPWDMNVFVPGQPWHLYVRLDDDPLDVFIESALDDFEGLNREFRSHNGYDLPLKEELKTLEEKAQRIQFWQWVLRKFADIAKMKSEILRQALGHEIQLSTNAHASIPEDYERWGEIFDNPGLDPRPMLLDNELGWLYYTGYACRLFADLTDKPIMVSPRANVVAAGARIVPTPNAIKFWYSQAIQNGAPVIFTWVHSSIPALYS